MKILFLLLSLLLLTEEVLAQSKQPQSAVKSVRRGKDSTEINFEETLLEGQMRTPGGSMLQGRKAQNKHQMLRLREHFRRELGGSRYGARAVSR